VYAVNVHVVTDCFIAPYKYSYNTYLLTCVMITRHSVATVSLPAIIVCTNSNYTLT